MLAFLIQDSLGNPRVGSSRVPYQGGLGVFDPYTVTDTSETSTLVLVEGEASMKNYQDKEGQPRSVLNIIQRTWFSNTYGSFARLVLTYVFLQEILKFLRDPRQMVRRVRSIVTENKASGDMIHESYVT